ncbi:hypothetical protein U9M49_04565 [Cytobacillus sp. OWB-43]|uniref:sodium:solute symporter family transporter n=1 Tax=Cytobacillus sp. OWB-43 TaxID=3108468 RepID=UPI002B0025E8|nr:hypothetical protein [Cytobacillus sp. OWB-43]MEA1852350.1 hypothetical protein [Cytobacillus sp. OWB-43]
MTLEALFIGMFAHTRGLVPGLTVETSDRIIPLFFSTYALVFGAIVVAAVIAAGISSINRALLSSARLLVNDIYARFIKKNASSAEIYLEEISSRPEFQSLENELTSGGSSIVNPLRQFIAEPVYGEEKIIYADIILDQIAESKFDFDVFGHYARPDIFQLTINEKEQENVVWKG